MVRGSKFRVRSSENLEPRTVNLELRVALLLEKSGISGLSRGKLTGIIQVFRLKGSPTPNSLQPNYLSRYSL